MRAIVRNVAYANKCVTLEVLRGHGTSSKDTVCDGQEVEVVVARAEEAEEEEETKKPRQVGGRGTTVDEEQRAAPLPWHRKPGVT